MNKKLTTLTHLFNFIQFQDIPGEFFRIKQDETLEKFREDMKFVLMLTAIEENSGHMIVLTTIEWGVDICLQYDVTKPMHSRISMTRLKTYCRIRNGLFKKF